MASLGSGKLMSYLDLPGKRLLVSITAASDYASWRLEELRLYNSLGRSATIRVRPLGRVVLRAISPEETDGEDND